MEDEFEDIEDEEAEESDEDFDAIEVNMNEEEIDEVIASLMELKEHKQSVQFSVAADLDLIVNYENEDELDEDSDDNLGEEFEDGR